MNGLNDMKNSGKYVDRTPEIVYNVISVIGVIAIAFILVQGV